MKNDIVTQLQEQIERDQLKQRTIMSGMNMTGFIQQMYNVRVPRRNGETRDRDISFFITLRVGN